MYTAEIHGRVRRAVLVEGKSERAVALAMARVMARLIYGVKTWDPFVFVSVAVVLSVAAWFAMYLPARRAMRVDPIVALRHE